MFFHIVCNLILPLAMERTQGVACIFEETGKEAMT
jgi:hypothetical protein